MQIPLHAWTPQMHPVRGCPKHPEIATWKGLEGKANKLFSVVTAAHKQGGLTKQVKTSNPVWVAFTPLVEKTL